MKATIAVATESYPFSANLDNRPQTPSGMALESQAQVVLMGLRDDWVREPVVREMEKLTKDSEA